MPEAEDSVTERKAQLQYLYGTSLKTYHVVASKARVTLVSERGQLVGVMTGCRRLTRVIGTDRKLTEPGVVPPKGKRLCKVCEEALLWWCYNGTWTKP